MNIWELIQQTTIAQLTHIAAEKKIQFSISEMASKMVETGKEWFPKILNEAKGDAVNADLLEGIEKGRIDPLVKFSFQIAIKHGCFKYAQFLLGINEGKK